MKNTLKKLGLLIATAAVFLAGTANVYAVDHIPSLKSTAEYQRFLDIETGN